MADNVLRYSWEKHPCITDWDEWMKARHIKLKKEEDESPVKQLLVERYRRRTGVKPKQTIDEKIVRLRRGSI